MNIDTVIKERRSIRKYQTKEIPQKLLEEVLEKALWAPSGMNKQDWELVVIRGKERDQLLKIVSKSDTVAHFDGLYNSCEIRYGDLKKQLAEDIIAYTSPIRERIIEILEDDVYLAKVAGMGAEKARESAMKTLQEVKDVIGFKKLF